MHTGLRGRRRLQRPHWSGRQVRQGGERTRSPTPPLSVVGLGRGAAAPRSGRSNFMYSLPRGAEQCYSWPLNIAALVSARMGRRMAVGCGAETSLWRQRIWGPGCALAGDMRSFVSRSAEAPRGGLQYQGQRRVTSLLSCNGSDAVSLRTSCSPRMEAARLSAQLAMANQRRVPASRVSLGVSAAFSAPVSRRYCAWASCTTCCTLTARLPPCA